MTNLLKAISWIAFAAGGLIGALAGNCGMACARHSMADMPRSLFSEMSGLPCDLSTFIRLLGICSAAFAIAIFARLTVTMSGANR
jgi:hypothetical protein